MERDFVEWMVPMTMDKWTVLSREVVVDNRPYTLLRLDRCRLPTGQEIDYYVNVYGDWVNALVLTQNHQVVLLQQYRHGAEQILREIPGGMVDPGEDPVDAVRREVREETGYASDAPPILLGKFYPNPATSTNMVHCFLIQEAKHVGEQQLDATEDISVAEYPFEQVASMIRQGELPHLFTTATYFLAKDWINQHSGR